jgi:hypothetical protein
MLTGKTVINGLFGDKPNPADKAMPYLDQAKGLYDPYAQQGQAAYNQLNPLYGQMGQDPAAFLENLMKNYEPSRGYQLQRDEGMRALGNSAAAGGMRGSMQDMVNESRLTDNLMGNDMQQWLQNVLGIQGAGMQGLQGFYNTGYDATNNLANIFGQQGNLAYNRQNYENANDPLNNLAKLGGTFAGGMFGTSGMGNMMSGMGGGGYGGDMSQMFGNMPRQGTTLGSSFF